jgi:hypothetical protein
VTHTPHSLHPYVRSSAGSGDGAGQTIRQRQDRTNFPSVANNSLQRRRDISRQQVNGFHRICTYGIAQRHVADPALPRTHLARIDPRITGNRYAIPAIRRCRHRMDTPEYVCHAVPRSNHARRQISSLTPAAVIDADTSRRSLRHTAGRRTGRSRPCLHPSLEMTMVRLARPSSLTTSCSSA